MLVAIVEIWMRFTSFTCTWSFVVEYWFRFNSIIIIIFRTRFPARSSLVQCLKLAIIRRSLLEHFASSLLLNAGCSHSPINTAAVIYPSEVKFVSNWNWHRWRSRRFHASVRQFVRSLGNAYCQASKMHEICGRCSTPQPNREIALSSSSRKFDGPWNFLLFGQYAQLRKRYMICSVHGCGHRTMYWRCLKSYL